MGSQNAIQSVLHNYDTPWYTQPNIQSGASTQGSSGDNDTASIEQGDGSIFETLKSSSGFVVNDSEGYDEKGDIYIYPRHDCRLES